MIHCNSPECVYNTDKICHRIEAPNIGDCFSIRDKPAKGAIMEAWKCFRWDCKYFRELKMVRFSSHGYCELQDIRREYPDGCIEFKKND